MRLPTASALDLAMSGCLHSFTAGVEPPTNEDPARFAYGNACHDVGEGAVGGTVDVGAVARSRNLPLPDARRLAGTAEHIVRFVADRAAEGWMLWAEVPVAYEVETGRARVMRPARFHRDYSDRRPGELTGTLDLVGVRHNEAALWDWKSGLWKARDDASWQLQFGGLAVSRILGASAIDVALLYVDEEGIRMDGAHLGAFELATAAAGLRRLWRGLHAGPSAPIPGAWCTKHYCSLLGLCATTSAALAGVRDATIATAEDAARVWAMLPVAEAALKAARAQVMAMASRSPIPLPNGKRLAVVQTERETVDLTAPGAVDVLRDALGERAQGAIDLSTSKAAIERAAGGKKAARPALEALRDVGAFKVSTYNRLSEIEGA